MTEFEGVRMARPDEVDALYQLLLDLHAENGLFTLDPVKARQTIVDLLDPKRGVIGVIDGPDGLEGSIGLYMTAWYYTHDLHLAEFWNFVRPDRRRSSHAKRLINFAKWTADQLGIPLHIGIVTTGRAEAKERLYRRQLKKVGSYFMHGATPRLNDEVDNIADKELETVSAFEELRGAATRVVKTDGAAEGRLSKRRREELNHAISGLRAAVNKADAVLSNGAAH